ncbi:hypothetical protein [Paenarthrobacter sp. NPDC090522]|uniref:hypothetical protein n=1 Tax=Paenarthrobacter sp. NPDC090522 TaxID=3364383 RepID=UPI00382AEEFC
MTDIRGLLTKAKSYHQVRRETYRPAFQLGPSSLHATVGQIGGFMAGVGTSFVVSAPVPWGLALITAGGLAVGTYFFPKPEGYDKFKEHSRDELEAMPRDQVRGHMQQLEEQGLSPSVSRDVLSEQASTAKLVAEGPAPSNAAQMPLVDLRAWLHARDSHQETVKRWSRYELDPEKQIRYPTMTDTREAPTAAMIRAMRAATDASEGNDARRYTEAADQLAQALNDAEAHARKHQVETGEQKPSGEDQ